MPGFHRRNFFTETGPASMSRPCPAASGKPPEFLRRAVRGRPIGRGETARGSVPRVGRRDKSRDASAYGNRTGTEGRGRALAASGLRCG